METTNNSTAADSAPTVITKIQSGKKGGGPSQSQSQVVTRTGNYNIFNGGKIRIDLTTTKYKLLRECALEHKWKVVTAKKKDADNGDDHKKTKEDKK